MFYGQTYVHFENRLKIYPQPWAWQYNIFSTFHTVINTCGKLCW